MSITVQSNYFTTMSDVQTEVRRQLAEIDTWIADPDIAAADKGTLEFYRGHTARLCTLYDDPADVIWFDYTRPSPVTFDIGTASSRYHVGVDTTKFLTLLGRILDVEKYVSAKYEIVGGGTLGAAILTNPNTGALAYVPNSGVTGDDEITYKLIVTYNNYRDYEVKRESAIQTCYLNIS